MAENVARLYGPWKGVNEWPAECELNELEDAWNVDFEGDIIRTRRGRSKIITTFSVYPKSVYREVCAGGGAATSARTDGTAVLTDGDSTTSFDIGGLGAVGGGAGEVDELYVGFASPVASVYASVGTANTADTTLAVYVWTQAGWYPVGALSDGTTGFHQSGLITGTVTLTMWKPCILNGRRLYWARIVVGGANVSAGTTITGVYAPMTSANGLLNAINGAYNWRRRTGERLLIVGMDSPSMSLARLYVYDWTHQMLRQMGMGSPSSGPGGGGFGSEEQTGPDAHWRFDVLDGNLVACNGYMLLHSDPNDPYTMVPFEQSSLVAGSVYSQDVPASAKFLRVYQGRLYIVPREHPNRVRRSEPVGANRDLTTGTPAPLGGANIWDSHAWFTAQDRGGGDITGLDLAGGNMMIFCPRSVSAFNGSALATIDPDVGCTAPNTIAAARGAVFFLGIDGVYSTDGGPARLISHKITPTIRGLNLMALSGAVGVCQTSRNRYRLHVPSGQNGQNDLVLVYDYQAQAWTKYGNPSWASMNPAAADYKVKTALSASDDEWSEIILEVDYDGNVWLADQGRADDTAGITSMFVSKRLKFDDQSLVTLRGIRVEFESNAYGSFYVGVLKEGVTWKRSATLGTAYALTIQQAITALCDTDVAVAYQVFGLARITTDTWRSRRIATESASLGGSTNGPTGRYWQIAMHNSQPSYYGTELAVRGFEADFILRKGTR